MGLTQPDTKEANNLLFQAVSILAEQGELVRRYYGYDKDEMLEAESLPLLLTPMDMLTLKTALYCAVSHADTGEKSKTPAVRLTLSCRRFKKNSKPITRADYLYMASILGVQPKESMMMCPGELADMFELWIRAHKKKEAD